MILGPEDLERGKQELRWSMQQNAWGWPLVGVEYIGEVPASFLMTPYVLQLIAQQLREPWVKN